LAAPHRTLLMAFASAGLVGGAILLWSRRTRASGAGVACGPRRTPWLTLAGLVIGAGLLLAGYVYA
ncbi:MAG TPA: mercuric reductase, partial [Caulobacteraceae bacterium]|nr:mercuric reductase [Caulobacteraceae bacterium]